MGSENGTGSCVNAEEIYDINVGVLNLDQFMLIYTVIVAYILPLTTIIFCYSIMIRKLTKDKKVVINIFNLLSLVIVIMVLKYIFLKLNNSSETQRKDQNKKRHRVLLMIALVTILFAFSWLGIHVIHIWFKFFPEKFPLYSKPLYVFKAFTHTLTYLNSMLNPFFYTIAGANFRKKIFSRKKNSNLSKINFSRLNNNNKNITVNQRSVENHKNYQGVDLNASEKLLNNTIV